MKTVRVSLGERSYSVKIGSGAIQSLPKPKRGQRAFIVSDIHLKGARASVLRGLRDLGWEAQEFPVEAGESLKRIESIYPLYGKLLEARADRDSVLFALGGGTIGDAAGFIAATYLRGIAWVGLPTTLLAQVDSSVGGKTGINHIAGKNLIGAIYQPSFVACDTDFLATLSAREMLSGLGETVKYGLAYDPAFFRALSRDASKFLERDPKTLESAIHRSLRWKSAAVASDERDLTGAREVLNFGHTFGHALESLTGYRDFQHGEAVIWGMRFALELSLLRRPRLERELSPAREFLSELGVPPLPPNLDFNAILSKMKNDKKVRAGKLHFVLLRRLGEAYSDASVTEPELRRAFTVFERRYR